MTFFKSFLASCLGTFVTLCLLIGVFIAVVSSDGDVKIADNSVLHLRLETPMTELELDDPFAEMIPGAGEQTIGLVQLKEAIAHAKTDPKIQGIFLNTSMVMTGIASLQELRESLFDFRESGKWVVAYADFYTEGAYYLATAADKIYLYKEGDVEFNGLATEVNFFKKLFDKLEIKPQVFRVGEYKSAVEPYLREDLSEENKLQLNSILNSIYGVMLRDISNDRKIPFDKLKEISDKMLVRSAEEAVTYGLVDSLFYEDQVRDVLRARLGLTKKDAVPLVKYSKYKKSFTAPDVSKNEIAVIVAEGEIIPGKSQQGTVGATTIIEQVRRARNNENVKAIVLRVNSPGGVFQAGDMMWREISLATKQKPVIASMSDYAASGGYYLAMACDTIVARPTTITGSIGVFTVLFDLSQFLGNKIGITSEEVKTGEIGRLVTVTRPLTEVEKSIWQKQTDAIYETFTSKAAEGRSMSQADLKKIASGRVWTGVQAKDNGLADVMGGLDEAVEIAAKKAGIAGDYTLKYYPRPIPFLERFFGGWEDNAKVKALQNELGEYYPWYEKWNKLKHYQGAQLRMEIEFQVK